MDYVYFFSWSFTFISTNKEVILMSILIYFATIFWSLFPNLIHVFQGGDDFINKVNETNLVSNGDFTNGTNGWSFSPGISNSIFNGFLEVNPNDYALIFQLTNSISVSTLDIYYFSFNAYSAVDAPTYRMRIDDVNLLADVSLNLNNNIYSYITTLPSGIFNNKIISYTNSISVNAYFGNFSLFNVSTMKFNGVKDDNGIPFTDLTNEQIKTQLDTWITEYGDLSFTITKDNTFDSWFNTGFVDKQAERDFLDYLGYFFWLITPPIILFITLDTIRRLL